MPIDRYKSISIEIEIYEKLGFLAKRGYRSIPKELARLVNAEYEAMLAKDSEVEYLKDKLMESLAAVPDAQ